MTNRTRRCDRTAVVILLLACGAVLSGCGSEASTVTREGFGGFQPAVLTGETQHVMISESRRIAYNVTVQRRDTLPILDSRETLVNCARGPGDVTLPEYPYPLNISLNITGEAAPAATDFQTKALTATPFPGLVFHLSENSLATVITERYYIRHYGTLWTSIEELTGGTWTYVAGSAGIWDLAFQLHWVLGEIMTCEHEQGIVA
jgi:hypothetical protein